MPDAEDYLRRKTTIASEMRTREWDRTSTWCKERAYFMASVDRADIANAFRLEADKMVSGEITIDQARETLRRKLDELNYQAPEGLEGSIKDLRTTARQNVSLNTNADMARGWAQHAQFMGDITNPGLMLYRGEQRKNKRNWVAICAQFAGRDDVVLTGKKDKPMVALSNSPVWVMLSKFGKPYPPFDYGSGMWTKPVSYDECRRMGLITDDNEGELLGRVLDETPESLNADLEAHRDYRYSDLKEELSKSLQGLAKWEKDLERGGEKLVFTDPNGSRPYDWKEIGDVITAPLPAGMENYQAKALNHWVENHYDFQEDPQKSIQKAGWDEREDLARLFKRIKPESSESLGTTLYRGGLFSTDTIDSFIEHGYTCKPGKLGDSWAMTPAAAAKYIKSHPKTGNQNVIMVMEDYKEVRPIQEAVRAVKPIASPDYHIPLETDAEAITLPHQRFEVVGKKKDPKSGVVYLYMKEVQR